LFKKVQNLHVQVKAVEGWKVNLIFWGGVGELGGRGREVVVEEGVCIEGGSLGTRVGGVKTGFDVAFKVLFPVH